MRGALAGSVARIAGGIGLVACAAVVALATGSGNFLGGLGGLFGAGGSSLEVARSDSTAADIVAAPNAAQRAAALRRLRAMTPATSGRPRRQRAPGHHHTASGPQGNPSPVQPPPLPSSPLPSPSPVPTPPPPSPGGGQLVTSVDQVVKQVTSQLPPQAQPITQPIDNAVDTLVQTCTGLPVCP